MLTSEWWDQRDAERIRGAVASDDRDLSAVGRVHRRERGLGSDARLVLGHTGPRRRDDRLLARKAGRSDSSCSAERFVTCRRSHRRPTATASPIEVMRERVQAERDLIESGEYHRWLNVLNSHHAYVRDIFDFMPRESEQDWRNVRGRLTTVPPALDKLRASFLYAADNGQVAARRQALACAAQCEIWGQARRGLRRARHGMCSRFDLVERGGRSPQRAFIEFGTWLRNGLRGHCNSARPGRRRAVPVVRPLPQRHRPRPGRDVRMGLGRAAHHRDAHVGAGRADRIQELPATSASTS